MAEVTWFKVLTDIFSDDKIKILQSMPEGDSLLVMWFKVLAQAGKTNDGGYIYLKKNIPYTAGMLSTLFGKPQQLVELAMRTFSEFGMIDIDEKGYVFVTNWEKHQSIDKLNLIKEKTNLRVQKHREKKKLELQESNVTETLQVTQGNAIDLELDLEKNQEEEEEKPMTAMDAYFFSFKKFHYTGYISGYVSELLKRGFTDAFIREVFMEMGARGTNPDVNYMRKLTEDWISKGIYTRAEADKRKQNVLIHPKAQDQREREAQQQQRLAQERSEQVETLYEPLEELQARMGGT